MNKIDWTKPIRFKAAYKRDEKVTILSNNGSYAIGTATTNHGDFVSNWLWDMLGQAYSSGRVPIADIENCPATRKQFILTETGEVRPPKLGVEWILMADGWPAKHYSNHQSSIEYPILSCEERTI